MRSILALLGVLFAASLGSPAAAQNREVKPYFLLVIDTSGSMSTDNSAPKNSCNYTGGNAATGAPTKLDAVKCALKNIINATGDADFGLMQFADSNMSCGGPSSCGPDANGDAAWLRVPIESNSAQLILPLLDKAGNAPANELCGAGYTPLGGVLIGARKYLQGTLPKPGGGSYTAPTATDAALRDRPPPATGRELCRPLNVILLTDGAECCNTCDPAWSDGCPKTRQHNASANITCDTGCVTPVGDTSCMNQSSENAPDRADELLYETSVPSTEGSVFSAIKTYAIGFGGSVTPPNTRIEHIAIGGGTDNPDPNLRGFYASNEAQLSAALTQIIADAQPPVEQCNNLDDDCDGQVDEGIPKYCNLGARPPITDKVLCDPPAETNCDGIDDDCDGLIDEGLLNACGMCGDVPPEICDGMDNDCDGRTDEDTPGGMCGNDVGICMPGTMQCIDGKTQCTGEVGPQPEICNCKDDDCDGMVDEDTEKNLCENGKCIGCECVPHCMPGMEFTPSCPTGLRYEIEQPSGECFCVKDTCDAQACAKSTLMRDDEVACAPNSTEVAPCLCMVGACVSRCDGVSCDSGRVCNKRNGRCIENNCRGLGCDKGELCDPVSTECVKDPCADASCKSDEVCRDGKCEPSCAEVACDPGQRCAAGNCVKDACFVVKCDTGDACDRDSGKCVTDVCHDKECADGLSCALSSGDCELDPCFGVRCPSKQVCNAGECQLATGGGSSGPGVKPGSNGDRNARVLAAGGGGCSCRVSGGDGGGPSTGASLSVLALIAALWRFRRRSAARRSHALGFQALQLFLCGSCAIALSGCKIDPFCLDCADSGKTSPATGMEGGAGQPGEDGGVEMDAKTPSDGRDAGDAGEAGGDLPDAKVVVCKDPQPETCDGKDNDCDFKVDEDTVAATNDCTQQGICAGTEPSCIDGKFSCRYPDEREPEETKCDGKDNDCDGRIDETFKTLNDSCDMGTGACKATGKMVCNPDGDGVHCEAKLNDPADEICDGIDNDCDGMVDEPRSDPGSAPSFVQDDVVQVSDNLWTYKYEASRPDAAPDKPGIIGTRACSRAGVLPWTNLTYSEALAACKAADMDLCNSCAVGDNTDDTQGADLDLCPKSNPQNDWRAICRGTGNCAWSYTAAGGSCPTGATGYPSTDACNGHDQSAQPGSADADALAPTGSFARCFSHAQGGDVFDLSGNAKEWTRGPNSPDSNPLRGGSYNNLPNGMRCDFDFNLSADGVRLPNVGFRCCSATQP